MSNGRNDNGFSYFVRAEGNREINFVSPVRSNEAMSSDSGKLVG